MYEKPGAPRPVGGVIDDAIKLYRESFRRCAPIGVLGAMVSTAFYLMVIELAHREGLPLTSLEALVRVYQEPPVMALNLLQLVLLLGLFGALIVTQNAVSNGAPGPSVVQALAVGFARLGRCVIAAVISTLLILAGCLLIVPGIYFSGILSLWPIAMYVDDAGAIQSLDASRKLIRGNWWHASTVLAVAMLVWLAFSMFAGFLANAVQLVAGADAAGQTMEEIISATANVFLLPIMPAAMLALANDLRLRQRVAGSSR